MYVEFWLSAIVLRFEYLNALFKYIYLQWWWMLSLELSEGGLSELLYVDILVLMSETIEGLRNKFLEWKEAFESKGMKANFGKTDV